MDTVLGKKYAGKKSILSLLHRQSNLQLYFLLEEKICAEVTRVFHCDPRRSEQKGKCERNHEFLREYYRKETRMNHLNQKDLNRTSNRINNCPRKSFQFQSPAQISELLLNKKVLKLNDLTQHTL